MKDYSLRGGYMDELKREFRGVWITREIWLDKRLNALDKVILAEIDSLDNEEKGCTAGNEYLAEFCQCSERKVSAAIAKLIEYGYIKVESFNGRTRILRSRLAKIAKQSSKICEAAAQKMQHNNKYNNKNYYLKGGSVHFENERKYTKEQLEALITDIEDIDI